MAQTYYRGPAAFTYQADVWCKHCGQNIINDLTANGKAPADPENESSYDSGDFPKSYDPDSESADSPQNCASGTCGGVYTSNGRQLTYGTFLENGLTEDGYQALQQMLNKAGQYLTPPQKEWAEFYGFSYFQNPYTSALDWLHSRLDTLAQKTEGDGAADLLDIARTIAGQLDGDTIQDLFQSDMDNDDYFKKTGWYSDQM